MRFKGRLGDVAMDQSRAMSAVGRTLKQSGVPVDADDFIGILSERFQHPPRPATKLDGCGDTVRHKPTDDPRDKPLARPKPKVTFIDLDESLPAFVTEPYRLIVGRDCGQYRSVSIDAATAATRSRGESGAAIGTTQDRKLTHPWRRPRKSRKAAAGRAAREWPIRSSIA